MMTLLAVISEIKMNKKIPLNFFQYLLHFIIFRERYQLQKPRFFFDPVQNYSKKSVELLRKICYNKVCTRIDF